MRVEQVTGAVAHHAEGPVWSERWGGLRWVDMLAGDVLSLGADGAVERLERADVDDVDTLQELLYGLYALIGTHFRKEEDIQLPAFDAAPEVTAAVLERMGALAGHAHEH